MKNNEHSNQVQDKLIEKISISVWFKRISNFEHHFSSFEKYHATTIMLYSRY